jgi:predicted heme/steroid binding protein
MFKPWILAIILVSMGTAWIIHFVSSEGYQLTMMRLFRNVSRYRSRQRRFGNQHVALVPILFGTETDLSRKNELVETGVTLTLDELKDMNGLTDQTSIFVSIDGLIFDVSCARNMYGPGQAYHQLVAKDATKLYATGCIEDECLSTLDTTASLNWDERKEVNRWLEFYINHDKYTYVGRLNENVVDAVVQKELQRSQDDDARNS